MVDRGKVGFIEKAGELLQIREIASLGMRGYGAFVPEMGEELEDAFPHEDTLTYRVGFCKEIGVGSQ
jgi:hypothetical protein